jgi:hypothetical protein
MTPIEALRQLIKLSRKKEYEDVLTEELVDTISEVVYRYEELKKEFLDSHLGDDEE